MALYETTFIIRQDISSSEIEKIIDRFTNVIKDFGGNVEYKEYWGLRNLAYVIQKSRKGHYVMFHISAPYAAIEEIHRLMKISTDVIRYMSFKVEKFCQRPTWMMTAKDEKYQASSVAKDEEEAGSLEVSAPEEGVADITQSTEA